MARRLFNILAALSLVLCVVSVSAWCATYSQPRPRMPPAALAMAAAQPVVATTMAPAQPLPPIVFPQRGAGAGSFRIGRAAFWNPRPASANFTHQVRDVVNFDIPGMRFERTRRNLRVVVGAGPESRWEMMPHSEQWSLEGDFWLPTLSLAALPATWLFLRSRRRVVAAPDLCPQCGYDLRATPGQCPECGKLIVPAVPLPSADPPAPPPPQPRLIGTAERKEIIHRIAGRGTSEAR